MKRTALISFIFLYCFTLRVSVSDRLAVDVRDNFFGHSSVFAQAVGFKVSWNLPDRVAKSRERRNVRIHRRAVQKGLENLLNGYNLNGNSCLQKLLIEWKAASKKWKPDRIFEARLLDLILGTNDDLQRFTVTERQRISKECPLTFFASEFV